MPPGSKYLSQIGFEYSWIYTYYDIVILLLWMNFPGPHPQPTKEWGHSTVLLLQYLVDCDKHQFFMNMIKQ